MQEHKNKIQNFKVYIINLDKDIDRMEYMSKQMQNLKIEYERVPAVYGKGYDFGNEYIESLAIKKNGKALVPGELGCAKSHKLCYEKILNLNSKTTFSKVTHDFNTTKAVHNFDLKEDQNYYLILEDDVCLPKNFKQIIEKQIEINNGTWDYLLFDYPHPGKFFIYHWINSLFLNYKNIDDSHNFLIKIKFIFYSFAKACYILPMAIYEWLRNIYYTSHRLRYTTMFNFYKNNSKSTKDYLYCEQLNHGKAVRFYRPLYLAGAYLIVKETAKKLLDLNTPLVYPADRAPDEARKQLDMKFYAYAPLCVYQKRESFGSSMLGIDSIEETPV